MTLLACEGLAHELQMSIVQIGGTSDWHASDWYRTLADMVIKKRKIIWRSPWLPDMELLEREARSETNARCIGSTTRVIASLAPRPAEMRLAPA